MSLPSKTWSDLVCEEFFAQGDLERSLNLPVTPFMDRSTAVVAKQQKGFYDFIARPMFQALDHFISMDGPLTNLDEVEAHWASMLPPEPPKE